MLLIIEWKVFVYKNWGFGEKVIVIYERIDDIRLIFFFDFISMEFWIVNSNLFFWVVFFCWFRCLVIMDEVLGFFNVYCILWIFVFIFVYDVINVIYYVFV